MVGQKPRMLIAEDSDIREELSSRFMSGFAVVEAKTGRQAFAIANREPRFDVCVLDIIMPIEDPDLPQDAANLTGMRLLKHLLDYKKTEAVVVLTVRSDVDQQVQETVAGRARVRILRKGTGCFDITEAAVKEVMTENKA